MSVVFTIPGDKTKYAYPTGPEDVTFGQFVGYLDLAEKAPKVIKDLEQAVTDGDEERIQEVAAEMTPGIMAKDVYPYFGKVVSYFTNLPFAVLIGEVGPGMNVGQLESLYHIILKALAPPADYEYSKTFKWNGETWIIPDRLMENSSVIEFAEAAQFQAVMAEAKNGHFRALVDVCAVILRKEGETYTDNIYKRNRRLFEDLPLSIVWQVAFFLMRRSAKLNRDFQIYTASRTLGRLKRELKTLRESTAGT